MRCGFAIRSESGLGWLARFEDALAELGPRTGAPRGERHCPPCPAKRTVEGVRAGLSPVSSWCLGAVSQTWEQQRGGLPVADHLVSAWSGLLRRTSKSVQALRRRARSKLRRTG